MDMMMADSGMAAAAGTTTREAAGEAGGGTVAPASAARAWPAAGVYLDGRPAEEVPAALLSPAEPAARRDACLLEAVDTYAEVNLDALRDNAAAFARRAAARGHGLMVVVKANGYGHGAAQAGLAALAGGAEWLAVARACEAVELREAGVVAPVLVLGATPPAMYARMAALGVSVTVLGAEDAARVAAAARQAGTEPRAHLKVNTGMNRLGVPYATAHDEAVRAEEALGVPLEGVFSHFPRADEGGEGRVAHLKMTERFDAVVRALRRRPRVIHAGNSATSCTGLLPRAVNLERVGIAFYGLEPSPGWDRSLVPELRPALRWVARLNQVKTVPPGEGVSYGHRYVVPADRAGGQRVGTIAVGYHDGFRRVLGNTVAVAGRRAPVLGSVCMDQVMIDLDGVPEARVGDAVELLSPALPASELAAHWGTIDYEVVCGIDGKRVARVYLTGGPGGKAAVVDRVVRVDP